MSFYLQCITGNYASPGPLIRTKTWIRLNDSLAHPLREPQSETLDCDLPIAEEPLTLEMPQGPKRRHVPPYTFML